MPPEVIPEDSDYASEEDSDFAPDAAAANDVDGDGDGGDSSDDEDAGDVVEVVVKGKGKRKRGDEEAEDAGFENSGDEAIIERGLKKRKKKVKSADVEDGEDDEGGEGGLIKTRSMRAAEKTEKKTALVDTTLATVDVDALWENMISNKPTSTSNPTPATEPTKPLSPSSQRKTLTISNPDRKPERSPSTTLSDGPDSMVMIKRSYMFAGKLHTEQKLVPRNSAEAKLFLATQPTPKNPSSAETEIEDPSNSNSPFVKPKRPPKKARRSIFEPIIESLPQRTDLHFGVRKPTGDGILSGQRGKEKKLNTVEKSAMDWAGFVDKEGIKDELDAAMKKKGAYKARQEFLARVEGKREEDLRKARGVVTSSGGL